MRNRLSDRFKQGDESAIDMMKRIQSEIITDAIADQWESKLEEFGVVFLVMTISRRRIATIEKNLRFFQWKSVRVNPSPKSKNTVIRGKNMFDFDPCFVTHRHSFCFCSF